ncbi:hypothetical protein J8F10_06690 [Gemmata sp. G18]|uniref:Uncharacterized protein n=1 Tax=Gemmata palustris TaxID=2822762 RepID=A0ABS5BMQ6_9BACT|nr:hypothetical protein [Gemmata palustris]MBP3954968.1 hypothetical protein [Gemmata palustris]
MLPNDLTATPYYHERAMEIMRESQGTLSYDQSAERAQEQLRSGSSVARRSAAPTEQATRPSATRTVNPKDVTNYMIDHGTTYDVALEAVREGKGSSGSLDDVLAKLSGTPANHEAAVTYMLQSGVSYDAACAHVGCR